MLVKWEDFGEDFTGFIEFEMPSFEDRMDIIEKINLDGTELKEKMNGAKALVMAAKERIKSMNIIHKSGNAFSSVDQLLMYAEGPAIMYQIGGYIMNGIPLGKN